MGARGVVEIDVAPDPGPGLPDRVVGVQIHLFVLDRAPQPLDEDVVPPGPLPSMLMATPRAFSASVNASP
jgi:hypothetical protein